LSRRDAVPLFVVFAASPGRTVHALLWAVADAAALALAGRSDLLADVAAARDDALADAGLDAGTELAWPVGTSPDEETLGALAAAGAGAVVLPADHVAALSQLTYTPSARADVVADGTTLPAVLTDERLSSLLAGRLLPVNPDADQAVVTLDPLTARQYLLAETAVAARERPADRRHPRHRAVARAGGPGGDARPPGPRARAGDAAVHRRRRRRDQRRRARPRRGGARRHDRLRRRPRRARSTRRAGARRPPRGDVVRVA